LRGKCGNCGQEGHNKRTCPHRSKKTGELIRPPGDRGQGRKADHEYPEVFDELEDAPDHPLEREKWFQAILAKLVKETLQGRGSSNINSQIVSLINTATKVGSREAVLQASDELRRDTIKQKPKPKGPQTQTLDFSSKPLR